MQARNQEYIYVYVYMHTPTYMHLLITCREQRFVSDASQTPRMHKFMYIYVYTYTRTYIRACIDLPLQDNDLCLIQAKHQELVCTCLNKLIQVIEIQNLQRVCMHIFMYAMSQQVHSSGDSKLAVCVYVYMYVCYVSTSSLK